MFELEDVQQLRDDALIERLTCSVRADRRLTVRLLIELGELDARGICRELGYSSLFDFVTREFGMSEAEAGLRIRAARVGRRFPVALEMLARQEVNLTTLSLLAPVLSHETLGLLHAARFKSKQEVLELLARHNPKPDAADSVRRLPPPRVSALAPRPEPSPLPLGAAPQGTHSSARASAHGPRAEPGPLPLGAARQRPHSSASPGVTLGSPPAGAQSLSASAVIVEEAASCAGDAGSSETGALGQAPSRTRSSSASAIVPLSSERHKISFTGGQRLRDLLREAQDLRRHRFPAGDLEPLFERALELLVAHEKKRKFGLTPTPRASARTSHSRSRAIPNAVRRQAWLRHGGQCCFVAENGQRCQARSRLEFHHVLPFARGGASRSDNIVLVCQAHNLLYAERDYGRAFMQRCLERTVSGRGSSVIRAPAGLADSPAQARAP